MIDTSKTSWDFSLLVTDDNERLEIKNQTEQFARLWARRQEYS